MKTSISIDDRLYLEAKQFATESHKTFTKVVEDALRNSLELKKAKNNHKVSLLTTGEGGLVHGIDLDDNASLNEIMD